MPDTLGTAVSYAVDSHGTVVVRPGRLLKARQELLPLSSTGENRWTGLFIIRRFRYFLGPLPAKLPSGVFRIRDFRSQRIFRPLQLLPPNGGWVHSNLTLRLLLSGENHFCPAQAPVVSALDRALPHYKTSMYYLQTLPTSPQTEWAGTCRAHLRSSAISQITVDQNVANQPRRQNQDTASMDDTRKILGDVWISLSRRLPSWVSHLR